MKKPVRITLSVAAALGAIAGVVLLYAVQSVDDRPYFETDYYRATLSRLRQEADQSKPATGSLCAGFGQARLTPTLKAAVTDGTRGQFTALPLAGYGDRRGKPATGIHDDLFVKAVALKVGPQHGVIVSADALIIPREVAEAASDALRQNLGLHRARIYFSATHTHAGLGGWGEGWVAEAFAGPFQPAVRVWFAQQIVTAVQSAMADLKPAAFGHGSFPAPQFVRNRLVGDKGAVDDGFSLMVLRQREGTLAVLGSYAAHATVWSSKVMEFGGDYPGYWQRAVEKATGGTALFLAGGIGSHSPKAGQPGFEGAEQMGEALAAETVKRLTSTKLAENVTLEMLGLTVDLPEPHARITDSLRLRPSLAAGLLHVGHDALLQVLQINDCFWVATPCDFSGELALGIKDHFAARGREVTITSFNGDYIGYVVPAKYYHYRNYESRLMSFFGPNTADYFDDLIRRLVAARSGE